MKRSIVFGLAGALLGSCLVSQAGPMPGVVLSYHGDAQRSGNFVVPGLTWDRARLVHLDKDFRPRITGHVNAQPLLWRAEGSKRSMLLVATESNMVFAIDAITGTNIWSRSLGRPVARASLPCGNIDPLGITGTPVIDSTTKAIYLDAAVAGPSGPRHLVFALSLKNGSLLPGWPVDVAVAMKGAGQDFAARVQNQRGALTIMNSMLFVPFGGHAGDCGEYHGLVLGLSLSRPRTVRSWATRAEGGGIWAPGGISADGESLFIATGNTKGVGVWSDGEAVIRLGPDLRRSAATKDFFAPSDWQSLDAADSDLGGTNPLPLDIPNQNGNQALILAMGKDGNGYLLDRADLGGIGGALVVEPLHANSIVTAPATYPAPDGDGVFVVFQGRGDTGVKTVKISAGAPPKITPAWSSPMSGLGSPIVTTTDGRANPIVWIVGAEGDNLLHGFRGDTGEPLFAGPLPPMAGLRHFQTLIATDDRLYVAADGSIYAFAF